MVLSVMRIETGQYFGIKKAKILLIKQFSLYLLRTKQYLKAMWKHVWKVSLHV